MATSDAPVPEEQENPSRWVIGAPVHFTVVGEVTGKEVPVQLLGDEEAQAAVLVLRGSESPSIGETLDGWVFDSSEVPQITTDSFGRLPISDGMRLRYQAAVATGLAIFAGTELREKDAEQLSELKGMYSRVARRDQLDWASVSYVLGHPSRAAATTWAQRIASVRKAVATGNRPTTSPLPLDGSFRSTLERAEAALSGRSFPAIDPAGAMVRRSSKDLRLRRRPNLVDERDVAETLTDGTTILRHPETQAKLERANSVHEETRLALADELIARGFEPGENQLIDLYCELPVGLAIYEVKSINPGNWRSQVRKGTAQLKEYRFLYGATDRAALYLVLSEPLDAQWVLDLLIAEYQIGLMWRTADGFAGPAAHAAMGGLPSRRS